MKLVAKESIEKYQAVGQTEAGKAVKEEMANDKKKELNQDAKPEKEKLEMKNGFRVSVKIPLNLFCFFPSF